MRTIHNCTRRLERLLVGALAAVTFVVSAVAQFSVTNNEGITVNDFAAAAPYPSKVVVPTNITHTVEKVTVTLGSVTHGYAPDMALLLVNTNAATPRKVVLMSDAGIGVPDASLSKVTFTLDDAAANALPQFSRLTDGTYKPASYKGDNFPFPAGAPAGPYATTLAEFIGSGAAGTWQLYVMDDKVTDAGAIGSWTLNLWTPPTISLATNVVTVEQNKSTTLNLTVGSQTVAPEGLTVSATSGDTALVENAGLVPGGSGANRTLAITPKTNAYGTNTMTVKVTDGKGPEVTATFELRVTFVNQAPSIVLSTNQVTTVAGVAASLNAHVTDIDTPAANLVLSAAASSNPAVVPLDHVFFATGAQATNRIVTVAPKGAATGTTTLTIQVVDAAGGTNTATFNVTVNAAGNAVFASTDPVAIELENRATKYPSSNTVAGVTGLIGKLTVVLANLQFPDPANLDLLLVGPAGNKVALMRGAGGITPVFDTRLTLDDAAANAISENGPIVTGTYRPGSYRTGNLLSPAPAVPYASALSEFIGTNPNGVWELYMMNQTTLKTDRIQGGWLLNIFPAPAILNLVNITNNEDVVVTVPFSVASTYSEVTNVVARSGSANVAVETTLTGTNATLKLTPALNFFGTVPITVEAWAKDGFRATNVVQYVINSVNDNPTISVIPKQVTPAGVPVGPIAFTVADVDHDAGDLVVTAASTNTKLLPAENIVLLGTGGSRTVTLYPVGNAAGEADVLLTVTDPAAGQASTSFRLSVLAPNNPLYANGAPITIYDTNVAEPYPSSIVVSNLLGKVAEVKVSLFGFNHPVPRDVDILLVGPSTNVVLMSGRGGTTAAANINLVLANTNFTGEATVAIPSPLSSGVFRPAVTGTVPPFPGAPTVHASNLSAFTGTDPNGTWSLYIIDSVATDGDVKGSIANGWQLDILTQPTIQPIADVATDEATPVNVVVTIGDVQSAGTVTVTATAVTNPTLVEKIDIAGSGATRTLTITPRKYLNGEANIQVTVANGPYSDSRTFKLTVRAVNNPPEFVQTVPNSSILSATVFGPTEFKVWDPETPTTIVVTASSSDQELLPDGNITITKIGVDAGGTNTWSVRAAPAGVRTGQTTITLKADDGTGQKESSAFLLTVLPNLAFENPTAIIIPEGLRGLNDPVTANGTATPYGSKITVSGVGGVVRKAEVRLFGLTHPFPQDLNVLLVSPAGKKVMLMAHAGGGTAVNNANITFTDTAANAIPQSGAITSGNYRPAQYGTVVPMPAPAPGVPYAATLAGVNGDAANGTWELFVLDDTFPQGGQIAGGWRLLLDTAPVIVPIGAQTTPENTPLEVPIELSAGLVNPASLTVTAAASGNRPDGLVVPAGLVVSGTNLTRTLLITATTNYPSAVSAEHGTNLITLTVTDGTSTSSRSFPLMVTYVDQPPFVTTATNVYTINQNGEASIVFTFSDVDSTLGTSNVVFGSSVPSLLPVDNIKFAYATNAVRARDEGAGRADAVVLAKPATNAFGSTVLSFSITDRTNTTTHSVTLNVNQVNQAPVILAADFADKSVTAGTATTNITFRVADVETPAKDLVVTAVSSNQDLVPNSNIVLVNNGENRTIQLIPVGIRTGVAVITITVEDGGLAGAGKLTTTATLRLTVTPSPEAVFANTAPITVRDANTAQPYPSVISVSNVVGNVHRVTVTLAGLTHTAPGDVDVLLVAPSGQAVMLMSGTGIRNPAENVQLVFDDGGAEIPIRGSLVSGTYKPSNYNPNESMTPPAPARPYGETLATLGGLNPNGDWKLYVRDIAASQVGQIAQGWVLKITPRPTILVSSPAPNTPLIMAQDTQGTISLSIFDSSTAASNLTLRAESSNPTLLPNANVTFAPVATGSTNYTATVKPALYQYGTNNLRLIVSRSDGASASTVVPMSVTPVNVPPTFSRLLDQVTDEGVPVTVSFLVQDVDTPLARLTIEATSLDQNVVTNANLRFFDTVTNKLVGLPSDLLELKLIPNTGVQSGTVTIRLVVTDQWANVGTNYVTNEFSLQIRPVNQAPTISAIADQVTPAGTPTPAIPFVVTDREPGALTVTATSSDQTLVKNASIVVSPSGGSTTNRTVQITPEKGVNGKAVITLEVKDAGNKTTTTSFVLTVRPSPERVFANSTPIVINDNAAATPYPSAIQVNGFNGHVSRVVVTLNGFAHRFPQDAGALLVSPTGQKVMLMNRTGGGTAVTNVTLTFDAAAANAVPQGTALVTGTYRPADYKIPSGYNLPAPAPASPYSTNLATFNGHSPNGTWSLYVVDDTPSDAGVITGGWSLAITTDPVIMGLQNLTQEMNTPAQQNFTIADDSIGDPGFTFTATSTNTALVANTNITFIGSGTNFAVSAKPSLNVAGQTEVTVNATNADGRTATSKFRVVFTVVNYPPVITPIADQTIAAGTVASVNFDYSDLETPKNNLILSYTSSNTSLVPLSNIELAGGQLFVEPVGAATGETEITISVAEPAPPAGGGLVSTESFVLRVAAPAVSALGANVEGITINDNAAATPYPSVINIAGVEGQVVGVSVSLSKFAHRFPDDVSILLVGPEGQSVVIMSRAGGGAPVSNLRLNFADDASASLPDNTLIAAGTYKPTSYRTTETFFAPAPAGPYGKTLSVFNGTNPNGDWSLYVQDDQQSEAGVIAGGWLLRILTDVPVIAPIEPQVTDENVTLAVPVNVFAPGVDPEDVVVKVESSQVNPPGLIQSLEITGNGTGRTLVITPRPNYPSVVSKNDGTAVITVTLETPAATNTVAFPLTVRYVNQPPMVTGLANTSTPVNIPLAMMFSVADVDSPATALVVSAAVTDPSRGRVTLQPAGAGNWRLTFTPSGPLGAAEIAVTAMDEASSTRVPFVVTVEPASYPIISTIAAQSTPKNVALVVPFTVTNTRTPNVTVSGYAESTALVQSVVIAGASGSYTVTITPVLNAVGQTRVILEADDTLSKGFAAFDLTVTFVNYPPVLAAIPDQTGSAGTPVVVPLNVSDVDNALTELTYRAEWSNSNLVSGVNFTVSSTAVSATVSLIDEEIGTSVITVMVSDGVSTAVQTFNLEVSEAGQPEFTAIRRNPDGTLTVEWTGRGTLQAAPTVVGPWQDVTGATSPYTFAPSEAMLFGRIRR
ncbi:MAG: proprotein convertase P-domain-containing protein [Verrucomicrobiales bacterium]|nr:proprotein convertase P-domain-containing protein [Verrucomicrobiales bacterium]